MWFEETWLVMLKLGVRYYRRAERRKRNLFTIFPIGTTIQDGGKRKRSNA